jgi:hypothetical protein
LLKSAKIYMKAFWHSASASLLKSWLLRVRWGKRKWNVYWNLKSIFIWTSVTQVSDVAHGPLVRYCTEYKTVHSRDLLVTEVICTVDIMIYTTGSHFYKKFRTNLNGMWCRIVYQKWKRGIEIQWYTVPWFIVAPRLKRGGGGILISVLRLKILIQSFYVLEIDLVNICC